MIVVAAPASGTVTNPELDCGALDFACTAGEAVNDAIVDLANRIIKAVGDATTTLATFWIDTPTPDVTSSSAVAFVQGTLTWFVLAVGVLSVLVGALKMAWERRAQAGADLVRSLVQLVIVSGAGLAGISLLVGAADATAAWIIDRSTDDFGADLVLLLNLTDADLAVLAVIVVIVVGLIALLASFLQVALLIVRNGFLVVLAGILPLSAAATNTVAGRQWFTKSSAWLLAFILYKPAAAIVYATAFALIGETNSTDRLTTALTGLVLMILALLTLPALMRFLTPLVGAAAGGGGGAAALGGVATGAVALGAARAGRTAAGAAGGASIAGAGAAGGSGPAGAGTTGPSGPGGGRGTGGNSGPTGGGGPGGGSGGGSGSSPAGGGSGASSGGVSTAAAPASSGGGAATGAAARGAGSSSAAGLGAGGGVAVAVRAGAATGRAAGTASRSANGDQTNDEGGPSGNR